MIEHSITEPTDSFVVRFPEADVFTEKQLSVFWKADEIKVEKDVHDILVNMTEAEKHGVLTVLKLFSLYELFAGRDFWTGNVMQWFPRPEIQRMAATFGFFELAVHQPFYNKINEALGIANDEFYNSYVQNKDLKNRVDFLDAATKHYLPAVSLATFSLMEGAILYSSFAFLKHFQTKGKNKLKAIVDGINFSVRDENLHHEAGAWLFRELMKKIKHPEAHVRVEQLVKEKAHVLREHEHLIVDMIFEKGKIDGITDIQIKHFVDSRINLCLRNFGYSGLYEVPYNPIGDWFYSAINGYTANDFFAGMSNEYERSWAESEFKW